MKIKFLVGALVLLIIVNLAVIGTFVVMHFSHKPPPPGRYAIQAEAPDGERQPRRHRFPKEHREELMVHLGELREETAPMREKIAQLEDQMFEALRTAPVSETMIDSLLLEISNVQYEMSKVATRKLLEAKKVLPREQQEVFFRAMLSARREHMGTMRQHRDGAHRGRRGRRVSPDSLSH